MSIREHLERLARPLSPQLRLDHARRLMDRGDWLEARDELMHVRASAQRAVSVDAADQAHLEDLILECAARSGLVAEVQSAARALSALPAAHRPSRWTSLSRIRHFATQLVESGATAGGVGIARALPDLLPESPGRAYLAARLLEAHAWTCFARFRVRSPEVKALLRQAGAAYRTVEATGNPRQVELARARRAGLELRFSRPVAAASSRARAQLRNVNPFRLPPEGQLAYLVAFLDAPQVMRRVRALDLIASCAALPKLAERARSLLTYRLGQLDSVANPIELERLETAIAACLEGDEAEAALAFVRRMHELEGLRDGERDGQAVFQQMLEASRSLPGSAPQKIYYQLASSWLDQGLEEMRSRERFSYISTPAQHRFDRATAALMLALDPARHVALVQSVCTRILEDQDSASALRPATWLAVASLGVWDAMERAHRELLQLLERVVQDAPTPSMGWSTVAELLLSAGQAELSARAFVRALHEGEAVEGRAGDVVLAGVRAAVEVDRVRDAKALLEAYRAIKTEG